MLRSIDHVFLYSLDLVQESSIIIILHYIVPTIKRDHSPVEEILFFRWSEPIRGQQGLNLPCPTGHQPLGRHGTADRVVDYRRVRCPRK